MWLRIILCICWCSFTKQDLSEIVFLWLIGRIWYLFPCYCPLPAPHCVKISCGLVSDRVFEGCWVWSHWAHYFIITNRHCLFVITIPREVVCAGELEGGQLWFIEYVDTSWPSGYRYRSMIYTSLVALVHYHRLLWPCWCILRRWTLSMSKGHPFHLIYRHHV